MPHDIRWIISYTPFPAKITKAKNIVLLIFVTRLLNRGMNML